MQEKMKITVDTNILISATFWNGPSQRIITKVEDKEVTLILSNDIIEEYTEVLKYKDIQKKIIIKGLIQKHTVEKLISISTIIKPTIKINMVNEDPDDNKIIECAVSGKADYLISQDNHLLKLKTAYNIPIITPEKFLEKLE